MPDDGTIPLLPCYWALLLRLAQEDGQKIGIDNFEHYMAAIDPDFMAKYSHERLKSAAKTANKYQLSGVLDKLAQLFKLQKTVILEHKG
jgi:hypothetical protein